MTVDSQPRFDKIGEKQLAKADKIVRFIHNVDDEPHTVALKSQFFGKEELADRCRDFQTSESDNAGRFWRNLANCSGVTIPSQTTKNMVVTLLDLLDDVATG